MGWAKYFEDIQKLRDHAASLRGEGLDLERARSAPERAIAELQWVHRQIQVWSEDLVEKLDAILDQATDPEINRQLLLDESNAKIFAFGEETTRFKLDLDLLQGQLDSERRLVAELRKNVQSEAVLRSEAQRALQEEQRKNEALRKQNEQLQREVAKVNERAREASAFDQLMKKDGTRPLKK